MNAYGWEEKEAGLRGDRGSNVVDLTTWHQVAILPHANIRARVAHVMAG